MVACGLVFGNLTADHYEDDVARNPLIDQLREKMVVEEEPRYSKDYLDPEKRSIANAIQIFFKDGSATELVEVEYPIGHKRRRNEGIPLLIEKFRHNASTRLPGHRVEKLLNLFENEEKLMTMAIPEFAALWVI
jgi:2-methylcitrate dehydratase PrpD